jgi:L-alanine-DL-glutamate epimerase-like enolase superfamily enzyme
MKITDIRCYLIEEPWAGDTYRWRAGLPGSGDGTPSGQVPHSAVLRVDTEAGITGCVKINRGDAVASLTRRRLKALIGEDALLTEHLWKRIWEIDRVEEMNLHHLGLLDLACWDIKSRAANMPLWRMLGGYDRRVPAYASTVTWDTMEEYERHIKECIDEGFTAFKLHAWGDAKQDAALSRNLRRWTGPDAVLMFDGSAGWDLRPACGSAACWSTRDSIGTRNRCASSSCAVIRSCATRSTFPCSPAKRRMARTGMPRRGYRTARWT